MGGDNMIVDLLAIDDQPVTSDPTTDPPVSNIQTPPVHIKHVLLQYIINNVTTDEKEPHGVRWAACAGKGSAGNGLMRHQHTLTHTHTHTHIYTHIHTHRCKH